MNAMTLELALALIMLAALIIYAWFAGADYGAGVWDLFARGPRADAQRDLIAHAIGPVWEANHVWLILVVVLLFTAFPPAFAAIMTALHVPISLMLIGIVLRGSAFTFRSYDNTRLGKQRWNRAFAVPSLFTPILLGTIIGAIARGGLSARPAHVSQLFVSWLAPFPVAVGVFTLTLFAFLAAVYLTLETDDAALRDDFRRRALLAGIAVGVLAYVVYLLARAQAPLVFGGLDSSRWGFPVRLATGIFAILALGSLWLRWFQLARATAMIQVALILWGCALALHPYLVPPSLTITNAAAPASTLRLMLYALAGGAVILFPSIFYMFRVFKTHTLGVSTRH